jgi:hypothetical protein
MKRTFLTVFPVAAAIVMLFTVTSCNDFFHSKDDISYVNLYIDTEIETSIRGGNKNYYLFNAEIGSKYTVTVKNVFSVDVTVFGYDTEEVLYHTSETKNVTGVFTADSDKVVVRIKYAGWDTSIINYTIKVTKN